MVRMSDVVRGIVREKPRTPPQARRRRAAAPPPPPRPRPVVEAPRPAPPPPPAAEEPRAVEPRPSLDVVAIEHETPSESVEPLFSELQLFLARVRELIRTGDAFPWSEYEQIIDRSAVSLERSSELFWVANNTAALTGVDYLAFHQARVAVLSMSIGASVGYDRPRRVQLGMAGGLIDVGLWQVPEALLRRLDALSADEQTIYRSHPRLSVELIRRWSPPREGLVEAVLQHHEREQGQGFPQSLHGTAVTQDAKILGLIDTYTGLTMPPAPRPRLRPHEAIRDRTLQTRRSSALVKALFEISVFLPGRSAPEHRRSRLRDRRESQPPLRLRVRSSPTARPWLTSPKTADSRRRCSRITGAVPRRN
jgi:hypothetical protein